MELIAKIGLSHPICRSLFLILNSSIYFPASWFLSKENPLQLYQQDFFDRLEQQLKENLPPKKQVQDHFITGDYAEYKGNVLYLLLRILNSEQTDFILPGRDLWQKWIVEIIKGIRDTRSNSLMRISLKKMNIEPYLAPKNPSIVAPPSNDAEFAKKQPEKKIPKKQKGRSNRGPEICLAASAITVPAEEPPPLLVVVTRPPTPPMVPVVGDNPHIIFLKARKDLIKFVRGLTAIPLPIKKKIRELFSAYEKDDMERALKHNKQAHNSLKDDKKIDLECQWNKGLAEILWSLEQQLSGADADEIAAFIERFSQCYYQDLSLHFSKDLLDLINAVTAFLNKDSAERACALRGSIFVKHDPKDIIDLDLILEPLEGESGLPRGISDLQSGRMVLDTGHEIEHVNFSPAPPTERIRVKSPDGKTAIIIDIICNFQVTGVNGLRSTRNADVCVGAVNWFLNGFASILPQAAYGIFNNLFMALSPLTRLADNAPYIASKRIKFPDMILCPIMNDFFTQYYSIDRLCNQPDAEQNMRKVSRDIVIKTLDYFFRRFTTRTPGTIRFIFDNFLLNELFRCFEADEHQRYKNYTKDYFMKKGEPPQLSGPAFLAMYFASSIIEQDPATIEKFLNQLTACANEFRGQGKLQQTITSALEILKRIPNNTTAVQQQKDVFARNPAGHTNFLDASLRQILACWETTHLPHGAHPQIMLAPPAPQKRQNPAAPAKAHTASL